MVSTRVGRDLYLMVIGGGGEQHMDQGWGGGGGEDLGVMCTAQNYAMARHRDLPTESTTGPAKAGAAPPVLPHPNLYLTSSNPT